MRKVFTMVLALLLLVSVTACVEVNVPVSGTPTTTTGVSSTPTGSAATTDANTPTADKTDAPSTDVTEKQNTDVTDGPNAVTTTTTKKPTTTTKKPTATTKAPEKNQTVADYIKGFNKVTVVGSPSDEKGYIYRLGDYGAMVREVTVNSGKGGTPVEIVQVTDIHYNVISEKDEKEANPTIMEMKTYRTWLKDGATRYDAARSLEVGQYADQLIVTGDTLDFLTWGALDMLKAEIWDKYPNAWITLGNHDIQRAWYHKGWVPDTTTKESRMEILKSYWKHNLYYTSKVFGNKAMVIQMDNSGMKYDKGQSTKLKADLDTARKNGYAVLIFQHVPISTGDKADMENPILRPNDETTKTTCNMYSTGIDSLHEGTANVLSLIKNNADIIDGIFTGHVHSDIYSEVVAKTADGKDAVIPQYVLGAAWHDQGHAMVITVK